MTSSTPIYPHGNIEEIVEDIFVLRGSIKMNPLLRITRNMGIIRNGDELTLINPVRVNTKVEAQLTALGKIKHVMRLGAFHGVDDPYYVEKFGACRYHLHLRHAVLQLVLRPNCVSIRDLTKSGRVLGCIPAADEHCGYVRLLICRQADDLPQQSHRPIGVA